MALIDCKECGHKISPEASSCPNCGCPVPKKSKMKIFLFTLSIFAVIIYFSGKDSSTTLNSSSGVSAPPKAEEWSYSESTDTVSGKSLSSAIVKSNNRFELEFPYNGGTVGTLQIRQHPRYGKDVIFYVNKGQILCNSYDGCYVTVKFDDKPAFKVKATEPADHSNDMLFLNGYAGLLKNIKNSKKMIVEVTFYHSGNKAFEFNTENLNWN